MCIFLLYELPTLNIIHFNTNDKLINFIQNCKNERIIIDTGGFDSSFNRVVLALSDIIITPVSDSPVETLRLIDFDRILGEIALDMKIDKLKTHIILNRIHSSLKNIEAIKEPYSECKNLVFSDNIIRDRARFKFSIASGKSVFEENKSNLDKKAISELKSFFKEINKILKN